MTTFQANRRPNGTGRTPPRFGDGTVFRKRIALKARLSVVLVVTGR